MPVIFTKSGGAKSVFEIYMLYDDVGRDRIVGGAPTTYVISAYHH